MKQAAVTKKPSINAVTDQALGFASPQIALQASESSPAIERVRGSTLRVTGAGKRAFVAPSEDRRLTINLRKDLHKKLKHLAVEQETNIGDILEKLIERHLGEDIK